jgi:hypothetical protein
LFFGQPARARVSGSRRCSPRKGASQRRRRESPPTSPPLSGKRRRTRGRRVRCPTAMRTRRCRCRRSSRVCRLLLLLPCPLPRLLLCLR